MNFETKFSLKNLSRRSGRTTLLLIFATIFAMSVFGGTVLTDSLQRGLLTLESRLGADIVVVPDKAKTKFNVNDVLLQGTPGYFYMDKNVTEKISKIEGIEKISNQIFLASMKADCCSARVQIVGFDPATDFAIQPWIKETYIGEMGDGDVVAGCNINLTENKILKFYNIPCRVVAQLEKTGSTLDNGIYANADTVRRLIAASQELGVNQYNSFNPDEVVSTVLVKVRSGYEIEHIKNVINSDVRHVKAVDSKNLIANISGSLEKISGLIGVFVGIIWILCIALMTIIFTVLINERKREFAILRLLGTSKKMLARMVVTEAVSINFVGGLIGIAIAFLFVLLFNNAIGLIIGVPFLLPKFSTLALIIFATLLASIFVGGLISAWSARKIANVDTSLILREGV